MKFFFRIFVALTILFSIFLFSTFDFTNKQFNLSKIAKIVPKISISYFFKKNASEFIDFDFSIVKEKEYLLKNDKVEFKKFSNFILQNKYYLTQNKEDIFAVTNKGDLFFYSKKEILNKEKIELKKIKTNIDKIIDKKYIELNINIIKGILIVNDKIYLSYVGENNGCYDNAILEGNLNNKKIEFLPFVNLDECKNKFNIWQGGNMEIFKNNKILFTAGDYGSFQDPQNQNSYYGKILSIDLDTKSIDMISMGHRNPQGLFYDSKNDIIFSTEHGPQGGDEINVNVNPNKNKIINYGWPISSGGEHYGFDENFSENYSQMVKNDPSLKEEKYELAPLHKSHKKYGFEEPIKSFTPSIGITEILRVNNSINDDYKLIVGSMGWNKEEDDMTVHILNFDKNFQETQYQKIYIGERIRDIIDLNDGSVLMTLESSGSFGILKNIY